MKYEEIMKLSHDELMKLSSQEIREALEDLADKEHIITFDDSNIKI